jgi:dephospho-CoA kinase
MIKIGVTGSLASGKTTVAKIIKKGNFPYFNADNCVRNLYKKKIFVQQVKKKLNIKNNKNILKEVKKAFLQDKNVLKKLEKLAHPLVRKEMQRFLISNKNKKFLILEIPLLIESKLAKYFDIVIFVSSKRKNRVKRYLKKGGDLLTFSFLDKRQLKESEKMKFCDHVIVNNESLSVLKIKITNILKKYD